MSIYPLEIPGYSPEGELRALNSPFNGELIAEVAQANEEAIECALRTAHNFQQRTFSKVPVWQRADWLHKAAELVKEQVEELAMGIAQEGGKPLKDARVEVLRAVETIKTSADEAKACCGEQVPMDLAKGTENRLAFSIREPIGVVAALSAFNHPVNLIAHQVAPALAAGCCVIIKPASQTPLSSIRLMRIFRQAGFPPESVIVTPCSGAKGEQIVRDGRIQFLTFIGSAEVGWHIRSQLHPGTRFSLEHGGNAAVIVHEDADLERAIPLLTRGAFYHSGQVCISTQRIYVHSAILGEFTELFLQAARELKVGDPCDASTDLGPLITKGDQQRVDAWVKEAVSQGARLVTGGECVFDQSYQVTILRDTTEDMKVMAHETFGPIACIAGYSDLGKAIDNVNNSSNPFQAAIFTQSIDTAFQAARKVNANAFIINDHTAFRVDWMPFGGRENAGQGVGGPKYAIEEMTRPKLIVMNLKA